MMGDLEPGDSHPRRSTQIISGIVEFISGKED